MNEGLFANRQMVGFLQRLSVPPIPLPSRFLPRLSFESLGIACWSGLLLDPTDHSPQAIITPASGVRLPLHRIGIPFHLPPWRLSYAEDEAVNGTL